MVVIGRSPNAQLLNDAPTVLGAGPVQERRSTGVVTPEGGGRAHLLCFHRRFTPMPANPYC